MQLFVYVANGHKSIFHSRILNTDKIAEDILKTLIQL